MPRIDGTWIVRPHLHSIDVPACEDWTACFLRQPGQGRVYWLLTFSWRG
jgi:hypothetical protein